MPKQYPKTRIAAVGDIHVRETDQGKWTEYFRQVSESADVLLICGDLTHQGYASEARILAEELHACSIPVVAVLGNHEYDKEQHKEIKKALQQENVYVLDGDEVVIGSIGFAGVKGFGGGFDNAMLSMFGEKIMKCYVQEAVDETLKLDNALSKLDGEHRVTKKIVVLHYAPIKETCIGEPEQIFPFLGSSRLAEPLDRRNVLAAFHGHAHVGTLTGISPGGVQVFNVSKPLLIREGFDPPFYIFEV